MKQKKTEILDPRDFMYDWNKGTDFQREVAKLMAAAHNSAPEEIDYAEAQADRLLVKALTTHHRLMPVSSSKKGKYSIARLLTGSLQVSDQKFGTILDAKICISRQVNPQQWFIIIPNELK